MASKLPTELWLEIISHLRFQDVHLRLRGVDRYLRQLIDRILRLPLHIWERVFTYLDYFALLNAAAACKTLRDRIQNSTSKAIKAATFREQLGTSAPLPPGATPTPHPAFERLRISINPRGIVIRLKNGSTKETGTTVSITPTRPNKLHRLLFENATSPPVQMYKLASSNDFGYGACIPPRRLPGPVTVRKVLISLERMTRFHSSLVSGGLSRISGEGVRFLRRDEAYNFTAPAGREVSRVFDLQAVVFQALYELPG
ncbi:hypothetical protein TWF718_003484 [Orbilia javanica]|uniref:F-box domain-containing protein n=1 Tax=Orbilia javanica TaxID=47235 RepID=A0AAN8RA70_9PEZI